jgi:hypothetical protein
MPPHRQPGVISSTQGKKNMTSPYRLIGLGFMLVGMGVLFSCAARTVPLEHQTPLVKNQPYEGTQQNMDYQLAYRYVFAKGGAAEPDRIEFTGRLTPRRGLETLVIRLHLLDAAGKMLATQVLYAPGAGQGAGRSAIDRNIDAPSGAVALAFSHFAQEYAARPILRRR